MSSTLPASSTTTAPIAADTLKEEIIAQLLPSATRRAFDVRVVAETGSTNSDLLRDAATLPSGSVLAAEHQTSGRGRRGRTWIAPPGGSLAFSLLWKFERDAAALPGLSLAVGVAVARALERCGTAQTGAETQAASRVLLKWPNDLLVQQHGGFAKLGGILIELAAAEAGRTPAVIGIGINIALGDAARDIDQRVTDLAALGREETPRNAVLAFLLEELLIVLRTFERAGFAPLAAEWNARHAFNGKRVLLSSEHGPHAEGIALGADADGALLLDTGQGVAGRVERIVSGEVSLRAA